MLGSEVVATVSGVGFGRLIIDDVEADDPYLDGLDERPSFEVVSDAGPRYRVELQHSDAGCRWNVWRSDPPPEERVGTVLRFGSARAGYGYEYFRADRLLPAGSQHLLINAVFSLI